MLYYRFYHRFGLVSFLLTYWRQFYFMFITFLYVSPAYCYFMHLTTSTFVFGLVDWWVSISVSLSYGLINIPGYSSRISGKPYRIFTTRADTWKYKQTNFTNPATSLTHTCNNNSQNRMQTSAANNNTPEQTGKRTWTRSSARKTNASGINSYSRSIIAA